MRSSSLFVLHDHLTFEFIILIISGAEYKLKAPDYVVFNGMLQSENLSFSVQITSTAQKKPAYKRLFVGWPAASKSIRGHKATTPCLWNRLTATTILCHEGQVITYHKEWNFLNTTLPYSVITFLLEWDETESTWYVGHYLALCTSPYDMMNLATHQIQINNIHAKGHRIN
jgi:hypothetical protein